MKFGKLTEVRFEHEYFGGLFSAFEVKPGIATRKVLKDFGLEFKIDFGRFLIAYDQVHAGGNRNREALLGQNLVLSFTIELTRTDLLNYTAGLDLNLNKQSLYFSNSTIDNPQLHQDSFAGNKNIYKSPLRIFPDEGLRKPFGKIVLKLGKGLLSGYTIRFEALATYWRYILVDHPVRERTRLSIVEKDTQNTFSGPVPIALPYGKEALSFVSAGPIKLSKKYSTRYQLIETAEQSPQKGRVLISALKYPNPAHISLLPQEEGLKINRNYSEIII